MCTRAWIKKDDTFTDAGTRGELRAALGVEPTYDDAEWPERSDDDCLCSCDVAKTAAIAGYSAKRDECCDWELTPNVGVEPPERSARTTG